jgi:fatty acid synthase subunit alpha
MFAIPPLLIVEKRQTSLRLNSKIAAEIRKKIISIACTYIIPSNYIRKIDIQILYFLFFPSFAYSLSGFSIIWTLSMKPEVEQELAHTLLVELLAYQFASPVRWIETQDVILDDKMSQRVVEVGPAATLGNMAKRTLAAKYESYDAAKSVQRQILHFDDDMKEIYYSTDAGEAEPDTTAATIGKAEAAATGAEIAPSASAVPVPAAIPSLPQHRQAVQIPDTSIQAIDIVRSLVAQKLKKSLSDISVSKAVKDLVGGEYSALDIFIWLCHSY